MYPFRYIDPASSRWVYLKGRVTRNQKVERSGADFGYKSGSTETLPQMRSEQSLDCAVMREPPDADLNKQPYAGPVMFMRRFR